jgi:head-tail adaptor
MFDSIVLRTPIRIQRERKKRKPGELEATTEWIDIGNASSTDAPRYKWCRWVGMHGSEAIQNGLVVGRQTATVTIRFDAAVGLSHRVLKDGEIWEIVSIDDVRQIHQWMELKVARKEAG